MDTELLHVLTLRIESGEQKQGFRRFMSLRVQARLHTRGSITAQKPARRFEKLQNYLVFTKLQETLVMLTLPSQVISQISE